MKKRFEFYALTISNLIRDDIKKKTSQFNFILQRHHLSSRKHLLPKQMIKIACLFLMMNKLLILLFKFELEAHDLLSYFYNNKS